MANSIYGINSIYAASSVNSIYGVNSYKSYLNSVASRQTANQVSSLLNTAVKNAGLNGGTQPESSSYLSQLNQSFYSAYMANSTFSMSNKIAVSSNSSTISGTAQLNATVKSYSLKISNLAATQVNTGSTFAANGKSVIGAGLNIFKIKNGTSEKNISLAINSTDTNKTAFAKLASAINRSDAGVKASVATDKDNKTYLTLESAKTGAKNAFSLTDLQGNAVSATGLGTVNNKAQDALYSVDGKQYVSSTNTINLDNGKVQATLKKAGNTGVSLDVVSDMENSILPDYYTYFNNMLSSGNYNTSLISGSLMDMFL
jgi:flagellar hook-associated protein 2